MSGMPGMSGCPVDPAWASILKKPGHGAGLSDSYRVLFLRYLA